MIVLDTNVISEPMRAGPNSSAVAWLNAQVDRALFTTLVTIMKLRFGVDRLPDGKRKQGLLEALEFTLARMVGPRILSFDESAAIEAARIAADAEASGSPIRITAGINNVFDEKPVLTAPDLSGRYRRSGVLCRLGCPLLRTDASRLQKKGWPECQAF